MVADLDLVVAGHLRAAAAARGKNDNKLRRMVGHPNVAVHEYQSLNLDIVSEIIRTHVDDLAAFARWALAKRAPR